MKPTHEALLEFAALRKTFRRLPLTEADRRERVQSQIIELARVHDLEPVTPGARQ